MGKKYIIEIEDGKEGIILCQKGIVTVGLRLENESELKPLGIQSAIPYTEPDLERVKKTAHDDGYSEGYQAGRDDLNLVMSDVEQVRKEAYEKGYDDAKSGYDNGFENGMIVAWEAARKLWEIDISTLHKIFYKETRMDCYMYYTATEAIEKIRQYEQEKEEKQHTWIFSEVNEPSVNTTLTCSKCGYTITIEPGDTQALNFCPKCGDNKRGE